MVEVDLHLSIFSHFSSFSMRARGLTLSRMIARVLSAGTVLLDAKAKRRYQENRPNDAPTLMLPP